MAMNMGISETPEHHLWWGRAHCTLIVICARKTVIHLRTEGQGLGECTDGHTAPQRPSLTAVAGTNPTEGDPFVPGLPNVFKQMKSEYNKQ